MKKNATISLDITTEKLPLKLFLIYKLGMFVHVIPEKCSKTHKGTGTLVLLLVGHNFSQAVNCTHVTPVFCNYA